MIINIHFMRGGVCDVIKKRGVDNRKVQGQLQ